MRVIGTAGHVDHGKSTLVRRLTGIDPDRLAEEKAREMTIDLGFAWLTLPDGETVGVVDVPGHRDFIENMLAGVGGVDAVLLVIAADEGVMPQTREHLDILDLLGIQHGLIVLTKTDMVSDPNWIDLVEQEILETVQGTALQNANIIRVSGHQGTGIDHLLHSLVTLLNQLPARPDYGQPRLPVDRVFTMSGFGTVVTGTLTGGKLRVGDEIELQPGALRGRVRGLQSYKQAVEIAFPGSRVAVNLAGIEKDAVRRGMVLAHPDQLHPTALVDVRFRHLPDLSRELKHNAEVKFFSGTAESAGFVRLLDSETVAPGQEAWLQLRLEQPIPLSRGDRFILRYPSPGETIGGGVIINPQPEHRWKRFQAAVIASLETQMQGTPAQRIAQAAESLEPLKRIHLQKATGYDERTVDTAIETALQEGLLVELAEGLYQAAVTYHALNNRMMDALTAFHHTNPLRMGIPREELRSRLGIKNTTLSLLLTSQPGVVSDGALLRLKDHTIQFADKQRAAIERLAEAMRASPYTPPSYTEAAAITGEEVLRALIELGEIIQVQPDVILESETYVEMVNGTLELIDENGSVDAKRLRDRFNTSRKYAIGLLEHLDSIGVTRRVGDNRVRR
jgi:selenocysteine-specific elongation factor